MKNIKWQIVFGLSLILLAACIYYVHFLIFHDAHHIFIYLLGETAFVPLEVLIVTLIIHNLLNIREKKHKMAKLNMVIGAFFSEVGTKLAEKFFDLDNENAIMQQQLAIEQDWTSEKFAAAIKYLHEHEYDVQMGRADLEQLRSYLLEKRPFLLRLIENPNLLEHDRFTDMLWAVFHLTEELVHRQNLKDLPQNDVKHLNGDMKRVYRAVVFEWIEYVKHLRTAYPYLFSLAMRTNPFNPNSSIYVR
ncbi:MAG: hypothetical protein A2Y12_12695 [Planctomycetes bacterium GWF2_42_9]|nr:MAG: hypothetical protein A2Y12_12695 [Planctomycetes bacterium GWF2_42_9]